MASNFPTAYVRVASQTYVLQHINYWLVVGFIEREKTAVGGEWLAGQHLAQFMTQGILSKQFSFNSNNNRYLLSKLGGHFLINRIDLAVAAQPCNFPT